MINRHTKPIIAHGYNVEKTGSLFKSTSEKHTWRYEIASKMYTLELDLSFITGKKVVNVNVQEKAKFTK